MPFEITDNVSVDRDDTGRVLTLEHFAQPVVATSPIAPQEAFDAEARGEQSVQAATPQALAEQYLREVAPLYAIEDAMLPGDTGNQFAGNGHAAAPSGDGKLELVDEKEIMGTTTVSYQQVLDGLPVWEAGVSVTIQDSPLRVTASQSSVHSGIGVTTDGLAAANTTPEALRTALGLKRGADKPDITSTRRLIYALDVAKRFDPEADGGTTDEALQSAPPTLPLPALPTELTDGQHYVVTEVLFTLAPPGDGPVHWRAFVEESTGAVVYLRAFTACATGMIFRTDPVTAGTTVAPTAAAAQLNPLRSTVPLEGLSAANPQPLSGAFVRIVDLVAPVVAPPTAPNPPASFFYDAPAREFAAVNAYHHCDWLFRHMQGMGFNLATYFDGTTFPVPVDAVAFNDQVNARAPGNATGTGSGGFQFGLAGSPFPAVSIAADLRVVLHEFGHTLLWDSVHSPNFGFAHSAGDSLAAVLLDPESSLRTHATRRFETFPWILPNRNHGRAVADGWGWGGANDVGGYNSEQILSTTMFRLYRSLGGDSTSLTRRRTAARQTAYLIFRGIGLLATNPVTPSPKPNVFATALANADIGTANFEGHRGGAFHKVIRWAFEKQGLFQPAGAPVPVTTPGAPPPVDVYIDDRRRGEYQFQAVHWENTEIWNRLTPLAGAGPSAHQTPVVGRTNHAFVKVRNRGTQAALGVVVRGYSATPSAGLTWPADWRPMTTAQIAVPGSIPPGGSVVVGPFAWRPRSVGHECMFMEVSARGDLSNIDPATMFPCAAGPTPEWRLVPFDNNLGQRNVCPVPGGGGIRGLLSGFVRRTFMVRNPLGEATKVDVRVELPKLLVDRGWKIMVADRDGGTTFDLGAGGARELGLGLVPGRAFTADDVTAAADRSIRVYVQSKDLVIGGMTYVLDPTMRQAPLEKVGVAPIALDDPEIEEALQDGDGGGTGSDLAELPPAAAVAEPAAEAGATPLLGRIGLADGWQGAHKVTVRETTVEIDLA
ncbi:hypothetical protein WEH80_03955 [Actinomycetes bacterium KLBMP 9759]